MTGAFGISGVEPSTQLRASDSARTPRRDMRIRWLAVFTLILLVAAIVRVIAFGESPPGLQHDEMFKALEGRQLIAAGDFRVFYPTNQGHEGGYVWALGLSTLLLGFNVLAVKFPAYVFGLLTVALIIRFASKAFSLRTAAYAGGLCAVTFFAVFTSRVGLRAVMLPVIVLWLLLALDALLKKRRYRDAASAGFALGIGIYTYTSAFALWGGLGTLVIVLAAFDRETLYALWRQFLLTVIVGLMLSLPMLVARITDPEGFNRSSTITRPLTDALAGQPQELLTNGLRLIGMAAFTGDPSARYNVPDRPYFPLPIGLFVYVGLGILALRLRRQPLNGALLGIMAVGLIPSLLTTSAPSFLRSISLLPGLMLCVAVAVDSLPHRLSWAVGLATVLAVAVLDLRAYFVDWPQLGEVGIVYRDDLEQLANAVRDSDGLWLVSTPDVELDALTFSIYAGSDSGRVSFFDGDTTLALKPGETMAVSPLAPLTPPHIRYLSTLQQAGSPQQLIGQGGQTAFDLIEYRPSGSASAMLESLLFQPAYFWPDNEFSREPLADWAIPAQYPVNFGNLIALNGVDLSDRVISREFDGVNIQLFLRPLAERSELALNMFVHVYRVNSGALHAQRDLMGMPPSQWLNDIIIIQDNFVVMGPSRPGWYIVAVGCYNVVTGERLPIVADDGRTLGDRVIVGRVRVGN